MKIPFYLLLTAVVLLASEPWSKNHQKWTDADAERVLTSSPWAETTKAIFSGDDVREPPPPGPLPGAAQAGMAGPHGTTDGHWDGGVGRMPRGSLPTLPVLIRWDSALPVHQAALQVGEPSAATNVEAGKEYVITVIGLVPAQRYRDSDLNGLDAKLLRKRQPAIAAQNAKLDGATGVLHFFFLRTDPISLADGEVVFKTRFGSLSVQKLFRLKDMTYNGRLEL